MATTSTAERPVPRREARFDEVCDELAELCGQQNAIAGRITELLGEVDAEELLAGTGLKSLEHFCTWQLGVSAGRARTLTAIARRSGDLPECVELLRARASCRRTRSGSSPNGLQLGPTATTPNSPDPPPCPSCVPRCGPPPNQTPTLADAFVRMAEHSLDAEAHLRPHGHRSTVVMHLDVEQRLGKLHLGPVLTDTERRYLSCDASFEVWFERDGQVIGSGRTSRDIPRRLRRALEHRDACCQIPGCGGTRGLHAHHIVHWEDDGPTELWNLVLVCPFHHRLHHRGLLDITGRAPDITVRDHRGDELTGASLARPPTKPPPNTEPYQHPTGERFDTRWYDPPSLS